MGANCCSPAIEAKDEVEVEAKTENVYRQKQRIKYRNGLPSNKVGVKVSNINTDIRSRAKRNHIRKMVFEVMDYEKKLKNPLFVQKNFIQENYLEDPYYIPLLDAIYIGEWVFDESIDDNVPGGIGRLYEKDAISEGIFKIFPLDTEGVQIQEEQFDSENREADEFSIQKTEKLSETRNKLNNSNEKIRLEQEESVMGEPSHDRPKMNSNFSRQISTVQLKKKETSKLEKLLNAGRKQIVSSICFEIKLNGKGRIRTREQQTDTKVEEILMEGDFFEGLLNGKGVLKIIESGDQVYLYQGLWKNGKKHGKGSEKTKQFSYQGNFSENAKSGKGSQIFLHSAKQQHDIADDIEKFELKMINEGEEMNIEVRKEAAVRMYRQKLIDECVQKFSGSQIKLEDKSMLYDIGIGIKKMHRTIFQQSYEGDFSNNKMHGKGIYIWNNGKIYKGSWSESKMSGKGEFLWPNGSYYFGDYLNDERHGVGIMIWDVWKRYRGNWAFGLRHGYGQLIDIKEDLSLTIEGAIWDRDKIKTLAFRTHLKVPLFNQTAEVQKMANEDIEPKISFAQKIRLRFFD